MRKHLIKVVSWCMLVIFLAGIMPKDYLHGLIYDHTDTVHPVYKKGELVISNKHTHCSFLGFVFAPFIAAESPVVRFSKDVLYQRFISSLYCYTYSSRRIIRSLRGPPGNTFI